MPVAGCFMPITLPNRYVMLIVCIYELGRLMNESRPPGLYPMKTKLCRRVGKKNRIRLAECIISITTTSPQPGLIQDLDQKREGTNRPRPRPTAAHPAARLRFRFRDFVHVPAVVSVSSGHQSHLQAEVWQEIIHHTNCGTRQDRMRIWLLETA